MTSFLSNHPFFLSLDRKQITALANFLDVFDSPKNSIIALKSEWTSCGWIVMAGEVEEKDNTGNRKRLYHAGDIIHLDALNQRREVPLSLTSIEPTRLICLNPVKLTPFFRKNPHILNAISPVFAKEGNLLSGLPLKVWDRFYCEVHQKQDKRRHPFYKADLMRTSLVYSLVSILLLIGTLPFAITSQIIFLVPFGFLIILGGVFRSLSGRVLLYDRSIVINENLWFLKPSGIKVFPLSWVERIELQRKGLIKGRFLPRRITLDIRGDKVTLPRIDSPNMLGKMISDYREQELFVDNEVRRGIYRIEFMKNKAGKPLINVSENYNVLAFTKSLVAFRIQLFQIIILQPLTFLFSASWNFLRIGMLGGMLVSLLLLVLILRRRGISWSLRGENLVGEYPFFIFKKIKIIPINSIKKIIIKKAFFTSLFFDYGNIVLTTEDQRRITLSDIYNPVEEAQKIEFQKKSCYAEKRGEERKWIYEMMAVHDSV